MSFYVLRPTPPVVHVHVVVSNDLGAIILAGFVGGLTILLGVIATEVLVRFRERRRALEAALWDMHLACGHQAAAQGEAAEQVAREAFTNALAQMRSLAKWPVGNRAEIVDEIDNIFARYAVALADSRTKDTPMSLGAIRGTEINKLIMGDRNSVEAINDALAAAGYSAVEHWNEAGAGPERPDDTDPQQSTGP